MRAHVLGPFGMTSSAYVWSDAIGKRMATAHDKEGRPTPRPKSTRVDVARYGSAGSLMTTATDYAKFLIEVIEPRPADAFRLDDVIMVHSPAKLVSTSSGASGALSTGVRSVRVRGPAVPGPSACRRFR